MQKSLYQDCWAVLYSWGSGASTHAKMFPGSMSLDDVEREMQEYLNQKASDGPWDCTVTKVHGSFTYKRTQS